MQKYFNLFGGKKGEIMINILITGSTGFIGKALINKLLSKDNIKVIATGRSDVQSISDAVNITHENFKYYQIKNLEDTLNIIEENIDVIIQLAWPAPRENNIQIQKDFVESLAMFFKDASDKGIKKFINIGSIAELEGLYRDNPYGDTRAYAKYLLKNINRDILIWPMITNCYGEYENSTRLIRDVIRKTLNNEEIVFCPNQKFYDFVYVDDVAEALFLIAFKGKTDKSYLIKGQSGKLKLLLEYIAKDILKTTNYKFIPNPEYSKGFPLEFIESLANILEEDTGYKAKTSLKEGIKKTYNYYFKRKHKTKKYKGE